MATLRFSFVWNTKESGKERDVPSPSLRRSKYTLQVEIKKEEREEHVRQGVRDSKRPGVPKLENALNRLVAED